MALPNIVKMNGENFCHRVFLVLKHCILWLNISQVSQWIVFFWLIFPPQSLVKSIYATVYIASIVSPVLFEEDYTVSLLASLDVINSISN